eukprot:jgi/Botrbrau1/7933/Bobra.9_2s0093.2
MAAFGMQRSLSEQVCACTHRCERFAPVAAAVSSYAAGVRQLVRTRPLAIILRRQSYNVRSLRCNWIVKANAEEAVDIDVEEDAMDRMEKSLDATKRAFGSVRTGRANPSMLDRIEVDYYGAATSLKSLAGVSVPDASLLVIQPYDKGAIQAIEKAISQSDLGITPSNDGNVIRLNIPQLTQERRKELTKVVAKLGEEGKVAIRNVRRDAMKAVGALKKDGSIGEDQEKSLEKAIDDLTAEYVKQVDELVKQKSQELTKV